MSRPFRFPALVLTACALLVGTLPLYAGGQKESGGRYRMISVLKPKSPGFDRLALGMQEAAADLGVQVSAGDRTPDRQLDQARIIQNAVNDGANAVLVVPSDPQSVAPALALAQVHRVAAITYLSPGQVNADCDVEMIDTKSFGEQALEEMVTAMGSPEGEYAVCVGSFTRVDHNLWADAAIHLAEDKYPGLRLVGHRFPVSEDQDLARQVTLDILAAHPDIKGFLCFGSQGGPGVARALQEKGLVGKVAVVGTTGPDQAAPYLKEGSLSASILWDPAEAGYAMVYLAKLVLESGKSRIGPDLEIPGLGKPFSVTGNTVVYNRPLVLTKDNVDTYSGF